MKTVTFTLQIQADHPKGSRTKKAAALKLCDNINNVPAQYDGVIGGAQIIPAPRNIKLITKLPGVMRLLTKSAAGLPLICCGLDVGFGWVKL